MDGLSRSLFSCNCITISIVILAYAVVIIPYVNWNTDPCFDVRERDFILFSKRVVTPRGVIPASVRISGGKIVSVTKISSPLAFRNALEVIDLGDLVVSPGLVDVHVHMNEPGRVSWEGAETATMAAAAGGVTTVVDMPLNSFPTTIDMAAFKLKLKATKHKLSVDVGFWAGIVPSNAENLEIVEQMMEAGALGLKSFMSPSGISDFPETNETHFLAALPILAKYGRPLLVHAEDPAHQNEDKLFSNPFKYESWLQSRPRQMEESAIRTLVALAEKTGPGQEFEGAKIHIVHLSDSQSLPLIQACKKAGCALTVETCPHYLHFTAEEVPRWRQGTPLKCAPPIRDQANREGLWEGLKSGDIEIMSSDHSPCPPELKELESGNFLKAWGGISGLQFSLPVTWTNGRSRNVSLLDLANWWSAAPAEMANLHQKGSVQAGKDADFVIWNPEASFTVDENFTIFHKHKLNPYTSSTLYGVVERTYLRGILVYNGGVHVGKKCGRQIFGQL